MKILYLISFYDIKDGSSNALYSQARDPNNPQYLIICKWFKSTPPELNIVEYDEKTIEKDLLEGNFDIIHYFKSRSSDILDLVVKKLKKHNISLPVVTTVCQNPEYGPYMLSPLEIKQTTHFVFIDKTSFNNKIIDFIPRDSKSQIYLSSQDDLFEKTAKIRPQFKSEKDTIIFGRGSTLSKCPSDMFKVFDAINITNKELHIVGVPLDNNWVHKEAKKRDNVKIFGYLPYEEWFEVCKSFDVFLYELPKYCHASLDANLGLAMLMQIPVVYYGCEAPKERFINTVNGYVADTIEQFIEYATYLAKYPEIRRVIGENGRISTIKNFSYNERISEYNRIYDAIINKKPNKIKIPLKYWMSYIPKNWKRLIHGLTGYYRGPK